jgi:hypothetical protein
MSAAAILSYLESNPDGAHPAELAEHIGSHVNVVCVLLGRLENDDKVTRHGGGRSRLKATWRIAGAMPPAGLYRADETLAAMQAACLARLLDQPALRRAA